MRKNEKIKYALLAGGIAAVSAVCFLHTLKEEKGGGYAGDTEQTEILTAEEIGESEQLESVTEAGTELEESYAEGVAYEESDIDLGDLSEKTEDGSFQTYEWTTYQGQEGIFINQLDDPIESMVRCAQIAKEHPSYVMIGCYPGREDFMCYGDILEEEGSDEE